MKTRSFLSRAAATISAAAMLLMTLSCGGGGGAASSPSGPNTGVLKPNVVAVVADGSITLTDITANSVTLSGKLPALRIGQVIIGGPAPGILRKITSLTQSGGSTILETTDAALTDAFQSLNLSFTGTVATQPDLKAAKSTAATSSGGGTINETDTIAAGVTVSISGGITLSFLPGDCVITLNKDNSYVRFVPSVQGTLKVTETAIASAAISFGPKKYASFPFSPIRFVVAGAPIWITPTIDMYLKADGQITAGVSVQSSGGVTVGAGIQYQNGSWSKVATYTQQFDVTPTISATADATCSITPVNAQMSVIVNSVGGPFINADLPTFTIGLHSAAPTLTVDAVFDGTVGLQVNVFGFNATPFSYPFTSPIYPLYPFVKSLTIQPAKATVPAGQTLQLSVTGLDSDGNKIVSYPSGPPVTWTIDKPNIATINANTGVLTGVSSGTVNVTATTAPTVPTTTGKPVSLTVPVTITGPVAHYLYRVVAPTIGDTATVAMRSDWSGGNPLSVYSYANSPGIYGGFCAKPDGSSIALVDSPSTGNNQSVVVLSSSGSPITTFNSTTGGATYSLAGNNSYLYRVIQPNSSTAGYAVIRTDWSGNNPSTIYSVTTAHGSLGSLCAKSDGSAIAFSNHDEGDSGQTSDQIVVVTSGGSVTEFNSTVGGYTWCLAGDNNYIYRVVQPDASLEGGFEVIRTDWSGNNPKTIYTLAVAAGTLIGGIAVKTDGSAVAISNNSWLITSDQIVVISNNGVPITTFNSTSGGSTFHVAGN